MNRPIPSLSNHALLLLTVLLFPLFGCRDATVAPSPAEMAEQAGTVTVVIRTDQAEKQIDVPNVLPGATVESVMRSIDQLPIELSGTGLTAFVSQIDGLPSTASKGWTFQVNGKYAKQGIGSVMVVPPATVTWTFGTYEETIGSESSDE